MADKIKERFAALRLEADNATKRAEDAEARIKELELAQEGRQHEIRSLEHKVELLTQELEKSDALLEKYKKEAVEGEQDKTKIENLVRTKQLLEEELDTAEKNHKDTVSRLQQIDRNADHLKRQLERAERECEEWEKKYAELEKKHRDLEKVLADLEESMSNL